MKIQWKSYSLSKTFCFPLEIVDLCIDIGFLCHFTMIWHTSKFIDIRHRKFTFSYFRNLFLYVVSPDLLDFISLPLVSIPDIRRLRSLITCKFRFLSLISRSVFLSDCSSLFSNSSNRDSCAFNVVCNSFTKFFKVM